MLQLEQCNICGQWIATLGDAHIEMQCPLAACLWVIRANRKGKP